MHGGYQLAKSDPDANHNASGEIGYESNEHGRRYVGVSYASSVAVVRRRAVTGRAQDLLARSSRQASPVLASQPQTLRRYYVQRVSRQKQLINIIAVLAAGVSLTLGVIQLMTGWDLWIAILEFGVAAICASIPILHRFGAQAPPLVLTLTTYIAVSVITFRIGTNAGLHQFLLVVAAFIIIVMGYEHIVLATVMVIIGTALVIALNFLAPAIAGSQPIWAIDTAFVLTAITASTILLIGVAYALRQIDRAEENMEREHDRSEALLANMLPTQVADRLKNLPATTIADQFDDASVLFADIADYTERASQTTPVDLVDFLNRLYTKIDGLVEKHGLEKIKTTGDCYMVVSGVPESRPDHLEALARFALELTSAVDGMTDNAGQAVSLRVGLASGPVVAGVIGTRRFFYDVWGDAVNVASRMESTGLPGRIQVPQAVYERLKAEFVLAERGEVQVKGKGPMRSWFLTRTQDERNSAR